MVSYYPGKTAGAHRSRLASLKSLDQRLAVIFESLVRSILANALGGFLGGPVELGEVEIGPSAYEYLLDA